MHDSPGAASGPKLENRVPPETDAARDLQAIWHYARGVAFAAKGDAANADAEASAIDAIEGTADFTLLKASGIPAHEVQDGTAQICPAEVRLV